MSIPVVVFDFDGTLVHSNECKRDAYFALLPANDTNRAVIWKALDQYPHGTRYDVIRYMLQYGPSRLSAGDALEKEVNRLAGVYDRIATEGAVTCPERHGATELLKCLAEHCSSYVLSTTPQSSLECILAARGWLDYFVAVRGAPCDKSEALVAFASREGVSPSDILMVGDGDIDRNAAREAGTAFLFIRPDSSVDLIKKRVFGIADRQ